MEEPYWSAVQALRLRLADFLASLPPEEWDAPSLCPGWRIRDVAGHLAIVPTITTWQLLSAAPSARFDHNRLNTALAVRSGSRPPQEIVQDLRLHAGDQRTARVLDTRNSLFDAIVHSQDIALALGREFPVPVEHTRLGLERVWQMGWPFKARQRLAGLTLTATDTDWSVGDGPQVSGTALALLLVLTGRTAPVAEGLSGPGVDRLLERTLTASGKGS